MEQLSLFAWGGLSLVPWQLLLGEVTNDVVVGRQLENHLTFFSPLADHKDRPVCTARA